MRDPGAEGERLRGGVGRLDLAGAAVVAAPAGDRVERLAEVGEDELAPAAVGLGERADHLQARAFELAAVVLLPQRPLPPPPRRRGPPAGGGRGGRPAPA